MRTLTVLTVRLFVEAAGEDEVWIAKCVEYDICASGDTITEAVESFARTLRGEFLLARERGASPLSNIKAGAVK